MITWKGQRLEAPEYTEVIEVLWNDPQARPEWLEADFGEVMTQLQQSNGRQE